MQKTLKISSRAFWDVDFEKLMQETDRYAEFIIRKVFEHGTFNDVLNVMKYFGKQKVIETMTNTTFLSEKSLHFASAFLNIEKTKFKCFTNKPQRHFYSKRSKI
jgi:hypothetical protein